MSVRPTDFSRRFQGNRSVAHAVDYGRSFPNSPATLDTWAPPMTRHSTRTIRTFGSVLLTAILALTIGQPVEAGPRRARLSRDLSERLAKGDGSTTRVIVCDSDAKIETLATRYGAHVKKRLRGCAVLEVTGGQLDALSQDADVDQLSGDAPVFRMSVTTEAIGADQVWAGAAGIAGFTGRGVGVAVVDTGIATHRDSGSIVVSHDFIEALGREGDDRQRPRHACLGHHQRRAPRAAIPASRPARTSSTFAR